ncbi:J domain-containing protein [Micromonospora sp. ZYX-F-536]|uniref:J domain-containing protein n=1 Tax=Micromonospora sp. ZYX-F-536 TaxID=3457629 RepID=UPI0040409F1F
MLPDGQDPYTILGVTRESSVGEIRERYRVLVQIWHPDRHQSSPAKVREEVTRQMQQINAAYKHLTDAHEREARARQDRERQTRERQERERRDRERRNRERQERERQDGEGDTGDRRDRPRESREHRDRERYSRERLQRERETREREHPRARWTYSMSTDAGQRDTPWSSASTIHPIAISLRSGETGFTLRAYFDEQRTEAAFPGAQRRLLLFRSMASMRAYLARTEAHELADIPEWESLVEQIGSTAEPDDDHCYEFDLIAHSLRFAPTQWVPELFITNRDLIREISEAFNLDDVRKLLTVGSPLDRLDDLFRSVDRPIAGWGARRQLASLQGGQASTVWRKAIRGIEDHVRWLR